MIRICRYACPSELAPVLEAALAANGYTIELPYQENGTGGCALVMSQGAASVLLTQMATSDQCEIDIWGAAQHTAAVLLESLPLNLDKLTTRRERLPASFTDRQAPPTQFYATNVQKSRVQSAV